MTQWKLITSFHIPQEVWNKAEIKAKEWGWTVEAVLCDSLEKVFDYSQKETEEMISIEIPKSLYDRINKHAIVERAVIEDMTEWVEIMEDEEKLAEIENSQIRFKVETHFNQLFPYLVISATKKQDQENDFVGRIDLGSKESVLRVAKDAWGISEEEIEFVN